MMIIYTFNRAGNFIELLIHFVLHIGIDGNATQLQKLKRYLFRRKIKLNQRDYKFDLFKSLKIDTLIPICFKLSLKKYPTSE